MKGSDVRSDRIGEHVTYMREDCVVTSGQVRGATMTVRSTSLLQIGSGQIDEMYNSGDHSPMPTALITGVTGQDGAYLSHFLLGKGYRVIGMLRRSASSDVIGERLRWLGVLDRIELVDGNLTDLSSLIRLMRRV